MTRAQRLTRLGVALGCPTPRKLDPQRAYFRCDEAKLAAQRDAAAETIQEAILRFKHRFSRVERARSERRRAERAFQRLS